MPTANLTVDAADNACATDTPAAAPLCSSPLLIAAGGECRGDIVATADLIIHGQVRGDISAPGRQVFIMAQGAVEGSIHAEGITIAGSLNGSCQTGALSIRAGGMFCGQASATLLQLEDGGIFRGTSRYQPSSRPPALVQLTDETPSKTAPPPDTLFAPDGDRHWMTTALRAQHPWLLAASVLALGGVALTLSQRQTAAPDSPARSTLAANTPTATTRQTSTQPAAVAATPTPALPTAPKPLPDRQPVAAKPATTVARPVRAPAVQPSPPQTIMPPRLTVPLPNTKPAAIKLPAPAVAPAIAPTIAPIARAQTPPAATPAPSAAPTTVDAIKEGAWLARLADWQTHELNMLIKASTRSRNSNQLSPLKGLIAQTAQQLMATRRLQRKYQPHQRIEPFIPDQATPMPKLSDAGIRQQHQQQLNALLAQADNDAFHADAQNLLSVLRQTAGR